MLDRIATQFERHTARPALFFDGRFHTYGDLAERVAAIQGVIEGQGLPANAIVGVVAHSDLETYASLLAIIFSGHGYLPVNPGSPPDRNLNILQQAGTSLLLSSNGTGIPGQEHALPRLRTVATRGLASTTQRPVLRPVPASHHAYLLFTSGSTGVPKGVPITRGNLEAFLAGFFAVGITMDETDRVLQMFELTFDFSVMSCFVPWVVGACLYPAAANELKFMSVYRLLEEQQLTMAPMVPSALAFLRPYFDEIRLEQLRYSVFCGEPLLADIAREWAACTPHSTLINFYGPTEATVFCSAYVWSPTRQKAHNGALSIGKPMQAMRMGVFAEDRSVLGSRQSGEICLAGDHLTGGYWNDPQRNLEAFFEATVDGRRERYYRTGDLGYVDEDGDFMFQGRVDQQVKVQGFRIELAEIEHHARACAGVKQAVAVALPVRDGNNELVLCLEDHAGEPGAVLTALRGKLPSYMVPSRAVRMAAFPLNKNGKIDRPAIRKLLTADDGAGTAP